MFTVCGVMIMQKRCEFLYMRKSHSIYKEQQPLFCFTIYIDSSEVSFNENFEGFREFSVRFPGTIILDGFLKFVNCDFAVLWKKVH